MTTLVVRFVFALLAATAALAFLAWLAFPFIVQQAIAWQLSNYGWQLGEFAVQRPYNSTIYVTHAQISDAENNYLLSADNILLTTHGLDPNNLSLSVEHARVTLNPSSSSAAVNLPALLDSYLSALPLPVQQGKIQHLQICRSGSECQDSTVEWSSDQLGTRLSLQTGDLHIDLGLNDQAASVTLKGTQPAPVDAKLELRWPDKSSLVLNGSLDVAATQWLKYLSLLLPAQLESGAESVSLDLDLSLPLASYASAATMIRGASGTIQLDTPSHLRWREQSYTLGSVEPLALELQLQPPVLQLSTRQAVQLQAVIAHGAMASTTIPAGRLCTIDQALLKLSCSMPELSLSARLQGRPEEITINLANMLVDASTTKAPQLTTDLVVKLTESAKQRGLVRGKLALAGDELTLTSSDLAGDEFLFKQVAVHHNIATQTGGLTLTYQSDIGVFSKLVGYPMSGPLVVNQQLDWKGPFDIDWQQWQVRTLTKVGASSLKAEIDGSILEGGNFEASFSGWPSLQTITPAHLSWKKIDVGIPVRKATMAFTMEIDPVASAFKVQGISADMKLLGGTVSSGDFSFDYQTGQGFILADLHELELMQIFALADEELHGTGKLNGQLPVKYDNGHIKVEAGHIESIDPGGLIQYKTNQSAAKAFSNAQMAMVMGTLRDFHYDTLKSDVAYSNKSILKLKTTLSGRNPSIENGRQINFNLNVEEDLTALLKSLQLSRKVSDSIDEGFP